MKKLIIIRHAKSSWEEAKLDHDRGLKTRGINDASIVSDYFKQFNLIPDMLLSSTAKRAKKTAKIFIENLDISSEIVTFDRALYDFSGESLIKKIKETTDAVQTLMVFGHNNAITHFVNTFGDKYIDNVPTCGLVVIEFHAISWKHIYIGKTSHIIFPKNIR